MLLCSSVILQHVNIYNAGALLCDATFFHVHQLKDALHHYIAMNMECLLERGLLDDINEEVLSELGEFLRKQQAAKLPFTRSGENVKKAMEDWDNWIQLQDIPEPYLPSSVDKQNQSPRLQAKYKPTRKTSIPDSIALPTPTIPSSETPVEMVDVMTPRDPSWYSPEKPNFPHLTSANEQPTSPSRPWKLSPTVRSIDRFARSFVE